jgi:hypothetical protein
LCVPFGTAREARARSSRTNRLPILFYFFGEAMSGFFSLTLIAGLALSAPMYLSNLSHQDVEAFIEVDSSIDLPIPCSLCTKALSSFLDFCKEFNGVSVPRVSEFVNKCSYIGEEEMKTTVNIAWALSAWQELSFSQFPLYLGQAKRVWL